MSRFAVVGLAIIPLLAPSEAHAIWNTYPIVDTCEWPTTVQVTDDLVRAGQGADIIGVLALGFEEVIVTDALRDASQCAASQDAEVV